MEENVFQPRVIIIYTVSIQPKTYCSLNSLIQPYLDGVELFTPRKLSQIYSKFLQGIKSSFHLMKALFTSSKTGSNSFQNMFIEIGIKQMKSDSTFWCFQKGSTLFFKSLFPNIIIGVWMKFPVLWQNSLLLLHDFPFTLISYSAIIWTPKKQNNVIYCTMIMKRLILCSKFCWGYCYFINIMISAIETERHSWPNMTYFGQTVLHPTQSGK